MESLRLERKYVCTPGKEMESEERVRKMKVILKMIR